MQIVNGYVCQTSCDVAAAKKGHDPKNPHDDPVKAAALAAAKGLATGRDAAGTNASASGDPAATSFAAEAVQFGGALAERTVAGQSAPATVPAGARVNLLA